MRTLMLLAALVLSTGVAHAGEIGSARSLNRQALARYAAGDFTTALSLFESAYIAKRASNVLLNIAECRRQLGDLAGALHFYDLYLERSPNAANREQVSQQKAELEIELADEGRLELHN